MPKFFITSDDGNGPLRHDGPIEFPDQKTATQDAQSSLADVARERLPNGKHFKSSVKVDDEAGDEVYRASLEFKGQTAAESRATANEVADDADKAADNVAAILRSKPSAKR